MVGVSLPGSSPLTRGKRRPGGAPLRPCRLIPAHAGKTRCWSACHFPFGAHPRSRGENLDMAWSKSAADGSSPLTRGKLLHGALDVQRARLIPAHAGKTLGEVLERYVAGAHPRSRGENRETGRIRVRSLGSSPLTRGKLPPRSARGRRRGLIPAHAGKTCFRRSVWRRGPAHPRSRGENDQGAPDHVWPAGSSPLTRGKRNQQGCPRARRRLIPAHAGKTTTGRARSSCTQAHPRSRGENEINKAAREHAAGSSPLTRGKPQQAALAVHALRLIPAHAGKTSSPTAHATRSTAHPRSRGENQAYFPIQDTNAGSSPLTRGKRVILRAAALVTRLIPAHAGKTLFDVSTGKQRRAHPRSRGENTCQAGLPQNSRGSSPLTRGKLHARDQGPCHPGLIPAHAGKTPRRPPTRPPPAAHPRSRGENLHLVGTRLEDGGSSPLTRGKHRPLTASKPMQRLIPAHAGKTDVHVGSGWWHGAHPRSRGENSRSSLTSSPGRGSSPLTRGKPSTPDAPRVRVGLIPAHAGKTGRTRRWEYCERAHPRSRGENEMDRATWRMPAGSSPLTRGKHETAANAAGALGLIPAQAGKTSARRRPVP